jgi:hypothetical protein
MNSRQVFTIVALGASFYLLYKSRARRAAQNAEQKDAKAQWENEGGAPLPAEPTSRR